MTPMREYLAAGAAILLLLAGAAAGQQAAPDQEEPTSQEEPISQEEAASEEEPISQEEAASEEQTLVPEETTAAELPAPATVATVVVYIEGIDDTEGDVVISLFNSSESFLNEPFRNSTMPPGERSDFQVRFADVPPGEYAVAVLHDLNGNGELERGLMGRAQEPIAFSNEVRFGFGPPEFADAAFAVSAGLNEVVIRF